MRSTARVLLTRRARDSCGAFTTTLPLLAATRSAHKRSAAAAKKGASIAAAAVRGNNRAEADAAVTSETGEAKGAYENVFATSARKSLDSLFAPSTTPTGVEAEDAMDDTTGIEDGVNSQEERIHGGDPRGATDVEAEDRDPTTGEEDDVGGAEAPAATRNDAEMKAHAVRGFRTTFTRKGKVSNKKDVDWNEENDEDNDDREEDIAAREGSQIDTVSHGEEEMEDEVQTARETGNDRFVTAQDLDDVNEYTASSTAPQRALEDARPASSSMANEARQSTDTSSSKQRGESAMDSHISTATPSYIPVNLHGVQYRAAIATALTAAAAARGFSSPVWSTKAALRAIDLDVVVPDSDGVTVRATTASVQLFNLDQTNFSSSDHPVASEALRNYMTKAAKRRDLAWTPRNVAGQPLFGAIADAVRQSPTFSGLQRASPIWLTLHDLFVLGEEVKEGEKKHCVQSALRTATLYGFPYFTDPGFQAWAQELATDAGVDVEKTAIIYNSSQLVHGERYGEERCPAFKCFSASGSMYSAAYTYLMRQYCEEYGFIMHKEPTIFVTAERVQRLGGEIDESPRRVKRSAPEPTRTATDIKDAVKANTKKKEEGMNDEVVLVVPPPFTAVMRGELVTLYNSQQTNMHEIIVGLMRRHRNQQFDRTHGEVV